MTWLKQSFPKNNLTNFLKVLKYILDINKLIEYEEDLRCSNAQNHCDIHLSELERLDKLCVSVIKAPLRI